MNKNSLVANWNTLHFKSPKSEMPWD